MNFLDSISNVSIIYIEKDNDIKSLFCDENSFAMSFTLWKFKDEIFLFFFKRYNFIN